MRHLAAAILHDDDLANDAVQETLIRLWRMRWRLGLMQDPKGFSMRTLRNLCIDMLRQQQRHQQKQRDLANDYLSAADLTDSGQEERFHLLETAISALPPQQKRLIELKYIEQHSIHEIARITNLSETNVRTILSRAYATIREALQNNGQ